MPIVFTRPAPIPTPWSLANVSFDTVINVSAEGSPSSVVFSVDGTKMYISGNVTDTIYQYTVLTPWDLATASYATNKFVDVSLVAGGISGLAFKPDGTKMYVASRNSAKIFQYSLLTAWDVSSATYDIVLLNVVAQDVSPSDVFFKPDGLTMYIMGDANDTIYQYTLTVAWDLTAASYATISFMETQNTQPLGMEISVDGTKLFLVGTSGAPSTPAVYQYTLVTPWLISSANYDAVLFDTASENIGITGITMKNDGTKMYISGVSANKEVNQYSL